MSITKSAIQRPVTVSMFVVAVILFGVVSLDRLPLNLLPEISYPSLTIQTDYEDAAPEEIENLVTRRVEEAVGVVSGLTRLSSVSRFGQSEVTVEFSWKTNMDLASVDVREKLDLIELPRDVRRPVILRFDPSHDPILRLQLFGDAGLSQLRYVAEKEFQKTLESTEGVAAVKVIGGLEEQIRVEIEEKRLAELGIPITEVTDILRQENLNQATGSLYDLDSNYLVRMLNEFRSVEEIRNIIIRDQEGRKVVLGDVARVWRGAKDRDIIARLNGKESVELAIYKEGDANTVAVSRAVQARLRSFQASKSYPPGVEYQVVFDQANFIQESVENVRSAALAGGMLATLVLFLFLRDLRSTLLIGLSIPASVMATFALMYQTGITLNIMSLGGVALGVGMLVDNSIVVLEAVHRHRQAGGPLAEAVYRGAREVGMAVTASTLTTVAVFVPLVFVEGIAGQLFKDQALTITYALVASLLIALTVIPMAMALFVKAAPPDPEATPEAGRSVVRQRLHALARFVFVEVAQVLLTDLRRLFRGIGRGLLRMADPFLTRFDAAFQAVKKAYPRALLWALDNKPLVLAVAAGLTVLAWSASRRLGAELIPPLTQGEFTFAIKLPEGKPLAETDRLMRALEARVREWPEVGAVFSSVGGSNRNQFARGVLKENEGQLYVSLKDRRDKDLEISTAEKIRQDLRRQPEVEYTFSRPTLFSFKTPIEVEVYTYDLEALRTVSDLVAQRLGRIRGLSDIRTTTEPGHPEVQIRFDRARLARLGLNESQVANVLRNKVRGDVATRYRDGDRQVDILVRADESDRNTIENIRNLVINSAGAPVAEARRERPGSGNSEPPLLVQTAEGNVTRRAEEQSPARNIAAPPIRLGAVAEVTVSQGPAEIRRIRAQRAAVVSANLTGRDLASVSDEIRAELQRLRAEIPVNTTVGLGGQNEELETSYRSLLFALGLAIFLVYLVMASQFESLVHPFIIMFSVPLAIVGVILSLFLTGTTISVMVILGVIILAGIVVNNAILLIDYTNQLRRQGVGKRQALTEAGQVRLRPIAMTTLTTVLGLIPMATGWGEGAEVRAPMAITVMGGLLFSTLLTLIFIPIVYDLVDRKKYSAADVPAAERAVDMTGVLESGD